MTAPVLKNPVFHAEAQDANPVAEIDGIMLLFHRRSGETHFLASPLPEMLALLAEHPCNADALAERLARQLDVPCDDEARIVVAARLEELRGAGLVWTA
jgi:PqqD family protein of HPr-rel-A system